MLFINLFSDLTHLIYSALTDLFKNYRLVSQSNWSTNAGVTFMFTLLRCQFYSVSIIRFYCSLNWIFNAWAKSPSSSIQLCMFFILQVSQSFTILGCYWLTIHYSQLVRWCKTDPHTEQFTFHSQKIDKNRTFFQKHWQKLS